MNNIENENFEPEIITESENFAVWRSEDETGFVFHLELGGITLHIKPEEWEEMVILFKSVP